MEFDISYTNQEITPWGGMVFLRQMLDKINFRGKVEGCEDLSQPGYNRGYSPLAVTESFLMSKRHGANRFMYTEITGHDQGLKNIWRGSDSGTRCL